MVVFGNDYKRINDILRFGEEKDIEDIIPLIDKYLYEKFEYGFTINGLLDSILIKLSKYPKYFDRCAYKYLKMHSNEYIEYILNSNSFGFNLYVGQEIENIDFNNYLDCEIASIWAKKPHSKSAFIKYLVHKNAYRFNIGLNNSLYVPRCFHGILTNYTLNCFYRFHKMFRRLYYQSEWIFCKRDFDISEALEQAFYELYHEKEICDIRNSLRFDDFDFQTYRHLKEICIIAFLPDVFLKYKKYFDVEIEAHKQSRLLLKKALETEIYLEGIGMDDDPNDFEKNRNHENHTKLMRHFDTIENLPLMIRNFCILKKEYNCDGSIKSLNELLNSLDFDNELDLSIFYDYIKRMGLEEFKKAISVLDIHGIQKVEFVLEFKKRTLSDDDGFIGSFFNILSNNSKEKTLVK